ncbi:hypothetical protein ACH9L7_06380 [Haloferax sp. S1W]|uniref:hypothetical protein n=1 Tax=Haloferax sp. S1W TaxID=3377110 RepID=UPI0037C84E50
MDNEPTWSMVIRSMYRLGEDYHEYIDADSYPTLRSGDEGTQKSKKKTEWCKDTGKRQYQNIKSDTNLSMEQIEDSVGWLRNAGLIDVMEPFDDVSLDKYPIRLNGDGFKVAHDQSMLVKQESREEQRVEEQNQINTAIGLLTLGLLFATMADTAVQALIAQKLGTSVKMILIIEATVVFTLAAVLKITGVTELE